MLQENMKNYTVKWIKGYPYLYIWVYMSNESIYIRKKTAVANKDKYGSSRESWQKASSHYKWLSLGRADQICFLNDSEIDLYIEVKMDKALQKLRRKHSEEEFKNQAEKVIKSWEQAKEIIVVNQEKIKKETTV